MFKYPGKEATQNEDSGCDEGQGSGSTQGRQGGLGQAHRGDIKTVPGRACALG